MKPSVTSQADSLKAIADLITRDDMDGAKTKAHHDFAWTRPEIGKRPPMTALRATKIFARDGFIDRYSGNKLVFPGALMLLHYHLDSHLPAGPTWAMRDSHPIFWSLWPAVDHRDPIAISGNDSDGNLVTTSTYNNGLKAHYTLQELEWEERPGGSLKDWDGLLVWFLSSIEANPELVTKARGVKGWTSAAKRVASDSGIWPVRA